MLELDLPDAAVLILILGSLVLLRVLVPFPQTRLVLWGLDGNIIVYLDHRLLRR